MTRGVARSLAVLVGTAITLSIGGCGNPAPPAAAPEPSSAPTTSQLPPRPATLRAEGLDPCALLTSAQLAHLGIHKIGSSSDASAPTCVWNNSPRRPDDSWTAGFYHQPAEQALRGEGAEIGQVGGFGAVKTSSAFGHRDLGCILDIDTAPDEQLRVYYENTHKDAPGMNHEVACQRAATAAEMMVANLRNLAH